MTPAEVNGEHTYLPEQTFASPADECLYGMGQYQDGSVELARHPAGAAAGQHDHRAPHAGLDERVRAAVGQRLADGVQPGRPADRAFVADGGRRHERQPDGHAGSDARPRPGPRPPDSKIGTFQSGAGGDYVFFVQDGNRFGKIALLLNGQQIAGIDNMWTPYTLSARVKLQAETTYTLEITGGGPNTKLFGRPLGHTTTFRSTAGDAIDYTFFYGPDLDDVIAGVPPGDRRGADVAEVGLRFLAVPGAVCEPAGDARCGGAVPQPADSRRLDRSGLAVLGQPRLGSLRVEQCRVPGSRQR